MSLQIHPLFPSPVAAVRRRLRLSRTEAARRLGIPAGHLRLVESGTRRIPPNVMNIIVALLESPEAAGASSIACNTPAAGEADAVRS